VKIVEPAMECPQGPFVLHERLYNNRYGVVFRVTDANSNSYALKSFAYLENVRLSFQSHRRLFSDVSGQRR